MSDLFKGCLLACDLDGTLVCEGEIPKINIEKIKYFTENGGLFAIATGRSADAVSLVERQIPYLRYGVMLNGGAVYDFKNKKVLFEKNLGENDKQIALAVHKNHPEIGIEIHSADATFTLTETSEVRDHQVYEEIPAETVDFETVSRYNWCKVLYMLNFLGEDEKILKIADGTDNQSDFVNTTATIYGRKREYFEQIPKNCSKAEGLKILCSICGIEKGGLFAIGDYYNDTEMLRVADISAAVLESPEDVKKHSDIVVCSAKNGAVADFIDYLTNKRKGRKN